MGYATPSTSSSRLRKPPMVHSPRKLIPDAQTIALLDTSPLRAIGHHGIQTWVSTFAEMTRDNYSFSLADGACAELMTAHARGSITNGELKAIVDATEIFLNSEVPVLLGKIDLMRMIGEADELGWEDEARMLSQRAWQMLKAASSTAPEERTSAEAELQEDRDNWIRAFAMFDEGLREWLSEDPNRRNEFPLHPFEHPLLEQQFRSLAARSVNRHPDMAERVDLRMRYTWR